MKLFFLISLSLFILPHRSRFVLLAMPLHNQNWFHILVSMKLLGTSTHHTICIKNNTKTNFAHSHGWLLFEVHCCCCSYRHIYLFRLYFNEMIALEKQVSLYATYFESMFLLVAFSGNNNNNSQIYSNSVVSEAIIIEHKTTNFTNLAIVEVGKPKFFHCPSQYLSNSVQLVYVRHLHHHHQQLINNFRRWNWRSFLLAIRVSTF